MSNSIRFYGRDYSKIEQDLDRTNPDFFGWTLSPFEKKRILLKFLEKVQTQSSGLIVNGKTNKSHELYSIFNDEYYFGGIVGVITTKMSIFKSDIKEELSNDEENTGWEDVEIILQIQSRFDVKEDKTMGEPYFLSTMLMEESNVRINNDFVPSNTEDYLFDYLLLFSYKKKLKEAYLKGLFRTYHRFEKNDDRVKGSIDVSRHIKENMGLNNGRIAYSYRENTVNNYLNHLIVTAYKYLKNKYFNLVNSVFDSELELRGLMDNLIYSINYPMYDIKTVIMKNLNSISHPFYTEYEALRQICLRILRNEGVSIFDGESKENVDGILFYMPDLWEKYLEQFMRDSNYYFSSQRKIKLIDYTNDRNYKQDTYPDYVFFADKKGEEPFMILDAKFKEKWSESVLNKSSFSGVLEDYDKCIRDMNSISGHATGVIFPTNDDKAKNPNEFIIHNISIYNKIDKFYTFPIYVPHSSGEYRIWIKDFNLNCKNVSNTIRTYVLREKNYMSSIKDLQSQMEDTR